MISTPVVIIGYARPKETKNIFETCLIAGVTRIYFIVDAPKINDDKLEELNTKVKNIPNLFESDIEIKKLYLTENVGPFQAYNIAMKFAFSNEERLIFLEDDKIPSISFYQFCDILLERFSDDERVLFISGLNGKNVYPLDYEYDYFFADNNTSWGHALWKRTYEKYSSTINYYKKSYYRDNMHKFNRIDRSITSLIKQVRDYEEYGTSSGHVASMEYYLMGPLRLLSNSLVIVPTKNLIMDVGATDYTVHGDSLKMLTRRQRKWYFRETFELDFPLNHPPFMMKDFSYLSKDSFFSMLINYVDKVERVILILKHRGLKGLYDKIRTKILIFMNKKY
jgi:hypothetical protein